MKNCPPLVEPKARRDPTRTKPALELEIAEVDHIELKQGRHSCALQPRRRRKRVMFEEKEIKEVVREERRSEKTGKYKPLPRNRQTERDLARIFEHGTERELMEYLRANG